MNPAGENTLGLNLELELHFFAVEAPPVRPPYYRVKHDIEMGDLWRVNLPEVFPLAGSVPVEMNAEWQQLSFDLYRNSAPSVDEGTAKSRWRILYGYRTAFTNGSGFEEPDDPRADYVNGMNLDNPLPLWDKSRVCGGATITGREDGEDLVVECLDGTQPPPALSWLLEHPWLWFRALCVGPYTGRPNDFPQGGGEPVFTPLVSCGQEVRIKLSKLEKLPPGSDVADPYWIP